MDVFRATRKGLSRRRANRRVDRKRFNRTSNSTRRENFVISSPMRGGTRL